MLKNSEIIEKLSEEQKLALATDIGYASNDAVVELGVPRLAVSDIEAINRECGDSAYPAFSGLVNSWNTKLLEQVVGDIVGDPKASEYDLIFTPPVQSRVGLYADGLSEDPYLNAKIAGACINAIEKAGASACLDGGYVRACDVDGLDAKPDDRAVKNVLTRACDTVMQSRRTSAVHLSYARLRGDWRDVNAKLLKSYTEKNKSGVAVCTDTYEEVLRAGLDKQGLAFLGAPVTAIRAALKNYRRMKEDVERGSVTLDEMENALEAGTAISDGMLDCAVDKVIEFARAVARKNSEQGAVERNDQAVKQRCLLATEEATVLLKNNGALPLAPNVKIATVGEIAKCFKDFDEATPRIISSRGATYLGHADGYRLAAERSDEMIPAAAELAAKADVVCVFAGLGVQREQHMSELKNTRLPANQCALIDALVKTGKPVIAIVTGGYLPDTKFDKKASALLFVPYGGGRSAESLFNILFGVICPSGKLTVSAYDDADDLFARRKASVAAGRYKIGEFVGYRRYISEGEKIKYPFGFGMSYTRFEYSNLEITDAGAEITVSNVGTRAGNEIVQMYIGKKDSAVVRPARELKGFAKVMIAPGAAVHIKFPITAAMLETLDEADGRHKTEDGRYEVYIGSSSQDIKMSGEITINGATFNNVRGDRPSDYLTSVTNIVSDGFKLNTVVKNDVPSDFKSARPSSGFAYEQLFIDEFGNEEQEEEVAEEDDEEDGFLDHIDDAFNVDDIAKELSSLALSKGYKMDEILARELVSAFAASRAVLTRCDGETFAVLTDILAEYFGCPSFMTDAERFTSSDDLFRSGEDTPLTDAVIFAGNSRMTVTVAALDNMPADAIGTVFAPFIRYVTAPDKISVTFGDSKRKLDVSDNMWFVMRLADGRKKFPAYLADMAAVVNVSLPHAKTAVDFSCEAPDYFRFVAACRRAERNFELDEPLWKKVDALERYVNARTPFTIGNKLWVQMEKYAAVQLACGAEPSAALDCTVAAKLIPYFTLALVGKFLPDDIDFAQTVENILGEDEAARSLAAIKRAKT